MTVIAVIETTPEDNSGTAEQHVRELSVEAESYEDGREELHGQVPEGWRIISLRRA